MSLHLETNPAGYRRASVNLKTRMWNAGPEHHRQQLHLGPRRRPAPERLTGEDPDSSSADGARLLDMRPPKTITAWRLEERYVLLPAVTAVTAVVATAADALDLTGESPPADIAPSGHSVLFLPWTSRPSRKRGAGK